VAPAPAATPLIVTLLLDPAAQAAFDALRRRHFPPERNHLASHVTLFHALPGEQATQVEADLAQAATRDPFPVTVSGVRPLGRGVAYALDSAELSALHRDLAAAWASWLTAQDRQPLRPHVTVQNKVDPDTARALHASLAATFSPYAVQAAGLGLWRYLGGPWEAVSTWPFRPPAVPAGPPAQPV